MEEKKVLIIVKDGQVLLGNKNNGEVKKITVGHAQTCNGDVINCSNIKNHNYVVYGKDVNNQDRFICECGVGFITKKDAEDHYNIANSVQSLDDTIHQLPVKLDEIIEQRDNEEMYEESPPHEILCNRIQQVSCQKSKTIVEKTLKPESNQKLEQEVVLAKTENKPKLKNKLMILKAINLKFDCPTTPSYRHILAEKLGCSPYTVYKKLMEYNSNSSKDSKIQVYRRMDHEVQRNAEAIHESVLQLLEKDPYANVRNRFHKARFADKKELLLHAIFRCSGLKVSREFLWNCANKLKISTGKATRAWRVAIEICFTSAEYLDEEKFTQEIMNEAFVLYNDAMRDGNHYNIMENKYYPIDIVEWNSTVSSARSRLVVACIFVKFGANIHWNYLDACAEKLKVNKRNMFKWWKETLILLMFNIGNPFMKHIDETVQNEATVLHDSIPASFKSDNGFPRPTNSIQVMHVVDNHTAYPKNKEKWMELVECIYKSFGHRQSFLHLMAYAKILDVKESFMFRHWYQIMQDRVTQDFSYNSDVIHEANLIKQQADAEVAKTIGYDSMTEDEMKIEIIKAEYMMTEIFTKYGVIENEWYMDCFASFLRIDFSSLLSCVERVKKSMSQCADSTLKMEIPALQEEAYILHNKIMKIMQNAWMLQL